MLPVLRSMPALLLRFLLLIFLTLLGTGFAQAPGKATAFEVQVVLSAQAAAAFAKSGEKVVVSASYAGEPRPSARRHVDEIGRIALGTEQITLAGKSSVAHVPGLGLRRKNLRWVPGPVLLNVNVYSARRTSPDNLLDCDFFDGELQRAVRSPMTLHCGLLTEHLKTIHIE